MVAQAVLDTGFRGWFSYEVFDGGKDGNGGDVDIVAYARAAKNAHERLLAECAGVKVPEEIAAMADMLEDRLARGTALIYKVTSSLFEYCMHDKSIMVITNRINSDFS